MSEPSTLNPVSLSASGYEDGLGRRSLEIDRESGAMFERLHLRPELGAFEAFLRERVAFTTAFEEEGFALEWLSEPGVGFGVGVHRYGGPPRQLPTGERMFTFREAAA